ncbi:MAG: hypothetical protein Q9181_007138 [Wetmoreana brouardii]
MSLLERCQWSIRDKGRINNLVKRLKECNTDLQNLCSFEALAQMNWALPALALPQHKNFVDLLKFADIAEQSAQDKASPTVAGLERLAAMARFKARLMTPLKTASKYQNPRPLLDQRNYVVRSTSHPYSLGKSLESQEPVFVEWQSYKDEDNQPNKLAEEQVHQLGAFLSVPHRPHEFRGLDCIGMFKDGANARYGMVYNLPVHLRNLALHEGAKNSRIYNPSTLTDLIRNGQRIANLGDRFDLAKKLMYSVVALHTCGWLHKDICPRNILFFAPQPTAGEKINEFQKDFGRPVIVGYGLSRPDDIVQRSKISRRHGDDWEDDTSSNKCPIYQHPNKVTKPRRRFRHSYDIYSLGLVLLEIGLWQDLQEFDIHMVKDVHGFRRFVLKSLVPDLWGQCGAIYGEVVRDCLTIDTSVSPAEEEQRNLALKFAERLDKCVT